MCDWNDHWSELIHLIMDEIYSGENVRWSLQPRTEADELHYLMLRFWFIDHETYFLPIWRRFISCGGLDLIYVQDTKPGLVPEEINVIKSQYNPFRGYYEPPDLNMFARYLGARIGAPSWGPISHEVGARQYTIFELGRATDFCEQWVEGL